MDDRLKRLQKIVQDAALDEYNKGRRDALDEVMAYSYGMLTAEKYGLQHFIESKRRETYREEENDDSGRLVGNHADVTIIDEACMKGADDETD